jgi:hypothetical protein
MTRPRCALTRNLADGWVFVCVRGKRAAPQTEMSGPILLRYLKQSPIMPTRSVATYPVPRKSQEQPVAVLKARAPSGHRVSKMPTVATLAPSIKAYSLTEIARFAKFA